MRRLLLLAVILTAQPALAQETIPLSQPVTFAAPPQITGYELTFITFQRSPVARVTLVVHAVGNPTQTVSAIYPEDCQSPGLGGDGKPLPPVCPAKDTHAEVATLMQTLNTGNHSVTSLWRKVLNAACTDFPAKFPSCTTP